MTLSARSIALQGIGAGALAMALQGLVPISQPVDQAQHDRISGGGGVVTSATISLSEWLELIKRRAIAPVGPRVLPVPPQTVGEPTPAPRVRTAERRRREEEALLLLIG